MRMDCTQDKLVDLQGFCCLDKDLVANALLLVVLKQVAQIVPMTVHEIEIKVSDRCAGYVRWVGLLFNLNNCVFKFRTFQALLNDCPEK